LSQGNNEVDVEAPNINEFFWSDRYVFLPLRYIGPFRTKSGFLHLEN
jgi:hypothetical protein